MPVCSVLICKNRSMTRNFKSDGITYHLYPRKPEQKEKWMQATGRGPDYWPTATSTICSSHFEEKCFQPLKKSRRLFEWAVPTLRLRHIYGPPLNHNEIKSEQSTKSTHPDTQHTYEKNSININESKPNVEHSPQIQKMKIQLDRCLNQIERQKKHIKRLQRKTNRYQKKISELQDILINVKQQNNMVTVLIKETPLEILGS